MNRSPAFQFYAGDWIKSRSVRMMDSEQRGWYIQLLAEAWDGEPQCMLPKDSEKLQFLAGVSEATRLQQTFNARWIAVESMFIDRGDYLANERQLDCLAEQMRHREGAVRAGLASAQKREQARIDKQRLMEQIVTESNGRSTGVQRKSNTPTPTSSPTSTSTLTPKNTKRECVRFVPPTPQEVEDYAQSIGYPMNGEAWCDSYAVKGWKVGKNVMKDWKAAVRNWKNQGWQPVSKSRKEADEPKCPTCQWPISGCTCSPEENIL